MNKKYLVVTQIPQYQIKSSSILRENDTFIINYLSRLGRTMHQVMKLVEYFFEIVRLIVV